MLNEKGGSRKMAEDNSMQTISRAIQILGSFSKEIRELSLAQLHQKLGLSKSSLQRILNTLVSHGYLEKDDNKKTYKLGMQLYYLGNLVEEHSHLISTVKPYLRELRDSLGENVYLNIIENNERKCIAIEEAKHLLMPITFIGQTSPLNAGASAKILLAFQSQSFIQKYIEEETLEFITEVTNTDITELLDELEKIKENGYAISHGERIPGVCSISAPVFNRQHEIIASVSIAAPIVRVTDKLVDTYISKLKEIVELISRDLRFGEDT